MCLLNEVTIFCIWRDLVRQSSKNSLDDFTDIDSSSDIEEILNSDSDEENKLLYLTKMGFSEAETSITMERCGPDSSIAELTDLICVDQLAKATDALLMVEDRKSLCNDPNYKHRVVPLKSDKVEMLLGFLKNHTRGVESARDMFPGSINVLSLFSMISDTEVVFYCLGIHLKTDVQEHSDQLEQLMSRFGEFNLVVNGIQCNNLTGRNKPH
ncbi:hypothetical protein F3Y22_tig00110691pilonHSYRG00158 [Hibiscus syriacus]|uniref:DNA (Cytosine-5)-methyltransferase DRM1/2 n=1 Tax=Hibiscus syriacus TaxID=106335 RepID=A0A6A2ZW05_HIBSY|nr:hypothetical protein F3Y22_tig00110691pilonHSYRG00158 [Hibiscus syriacus]